jgi:hypothetical protein
MTCSFDRLFARNRTQLSDEDYILCRLLRLSFEKEKVQQFYVKNEASHFTFNWVKYFLIISGFLNSHILSCFLELFFRLT